MRLTALVRPIVIRPDELAQEAIKFLAACSGLGPTPQRTALSDLAVRRIVAALYDGDVDRVTRWYQIQQGEAPDAIADIVHAACHAVARGFERDDPQQLGQALWALEIIECEVTRPTERRQCCHEHPLGVSIALKMTA
jgi:hypothetical protein